MHCWNLFEVTVGWKSDKSSFFLIAKLVLPWQSVWKLKQSRGFFISNGSWCIQSLMYFCIKSPQSKTPHACVPQSPFSSRLFTFPEFWVITQRRVNIILHPSQGLGQSRTPHDKQKVISLPIHFSCTQPLSWCPSRAWEAGKQESQRNRPGLE